MQKSSLEPQGFGQAERPGSAEEDSVHIGAAGVVQEKSRVPGEAELATEGPGFEVGLCRGRSGRSSDAFKPSDEGDIGRSGGPVAGFNDEALVVLGLALVSQILAPDLEIGNCEPGVDGEHLFAGAERFGVEKSGSADLEAVVVPGGAERSPVEFVRQ